MARTWSSRLVVLVLGAALAVAAGSASGRAASSTEPATASAVRDALGGMRFTGAYAVADSRGNIVTAVRGRGLTPATVFDIGSVAKLFTAAAVLALRQAGKLSLGDAIGAYLPDAVPRADASITIRSLLTHTSGLPGDFSSDLDRLTEHAAVRRILRLQRGVPGRFEYSNAGYVLLAAIVQHVAHMPFQLYVRARLLRRAGLEATGWYHERRFAHMRLAHGFVGSVDRGAAGDRPLSWSILGAGGMLSTAGDLYRWVTALDNGRVLDRRQTRELMQGDVPLPGQPGVEAGFGGIVARTKHGRVVAVGGGTDFGFTADVRRFLPQGVVTVILSNSDRAPADRAGFAVAHALGL